MANFESIILDETRCFSIYLTCARLPVVVH